MKCLVLADHRVFYGIVARSVGSAVEASFWLGKGERTPYAEMADVFRGEPDDPATYASFDAAEEYAALLYFQARADAERAARAIEKVLPKTYFLFIGLDGALPAPDIVAHGRVRNWQEMIGARITAEVRTLTTAWRVERVRELLGGEGTRLAVLLQDDPDPDAIAGALVLRNLVGRNRKSAPIVTFGAVTRPENREMTRLLDIPIETIKPEDLAGFDRVALVDIQPNVLGERLAGREIDVVIDHHPEQPGYRARYRDIRPSYGATSTILAEYLRSAGYEANQKQATALLYGIKSDTLFFDREAGAADLEAFSYLYPRVNLNLLRRIEKPAIPTDTLKRFGGALAKLELEGGLSFAWLGRVEREDVIPQLADLLMTVEGADWAVAVGIDSGRVVASVRNAGFQRSAGEVVKRVFGEIGSAGGHRAMAKAIVPVEAFVEAFGGADEASVRKVFFGKFLAEATRTAEG